MKHIFAAALALSVVGGAAAGAAAPADMFGASQTDKQKENDKQKQKEQPGVRNAQGPANANRNNPPARQPNTRKPVVNTEVLRNPATTVDNTSSNRRVRKPTNRTPVVRTQVVRNPAPMLPPVVQVQPRNPAIWNNPVVRPGNLRWSRGDRMPDQYRRDQYYVNDWQQRGLRNPPRGYRWVRNDNNDFFLLLIATGIIAEAVSHSDRDRSWNQHYSRTYSYNDDVYYRECRTSADPAGIIVGGLIGGLIGNAAGHGNAGATFAGVIFGGALGASLTSNMDCEDRSYAYRSYYDGFNSGRSGHAYAWRNPRNDHRGEFRIRSYYNDEYGFRCANFTQVTYINGRSYTGTGRACRQPDGAWAVVN